MPTLDEHLATLYRERSLSAQEVNALLAVRDRWRTFLTVEGELEVVGRLRYRANVEDALEALGAILREAGREIADCDTTTPYGLTHSMLIRTEVNRWVIDSVSGYLDEKQKTAVHRLMRNQKLAR